MFKVDPSGNETLLYSFDGKSDGRQPFGALARDSSGNLYGTTYEGGDFNCNPPITGCGTVFKLDTAHVLTVLHFFESGSDGGNCKLHGDFRYDSLKNLPADLATQNAALSECLVNAGNRFGFIVTGYSGYPSRSRDCEGSEFAGDRLRKALFQRA